jgi:hypothetical protein
LAIVARLFVEPESSQRFGTSLSNLMGGPTKHFREPDGTPTFSKEQFRFLSDFLHPPQKLAIH